MDLWGTLRIIGRRWYVVVPALAITAVVAIVAGARTEVTYTATGSTVFLAASDAKTANPYQNFNPSLQTTAQVVGNDVSSDAVRNTFAQNELDSQYKIVVPYDPTRAVLLPEVDYTVETSDPRVATRTVQVLSETVAKTLADRQEASGAPRESWIQAVPGPSSAEPVRNSGSRIRTTAIVLMLGIAISLSLAFVAEGLASARRSRHRPATGAPLDITDGDVESAATDGVGTHPEHATRANANERRTAGARPAARRRP
ncbi:MAG: hypothetical protein ACOYNI_05260 [Acidimicrobiia bacterium]